MPTVTLKYYGEDDDGGSRDATVVGGVYVCAS